jgi:hypothetical protein
MAKIAKKNENGFTLIEILLISVIVLLIAVSVTMLFTGGRKTWTSADKGSETIQNAVIGMEKLVREIKNSPGLTDFNEAIGAEPEIRFKILRKDGSGKDITRYAKVKREGNYLKYGERATDSETDGDWTLSSLVYPEFPLSNLAYPVTNLSFTFKKLNGDTATELSDVKSVVINMTTSEDGVTIPLKSSTYLVMEEATAQEMNFDGTPDDPNDPAPPGSEEHHFNEGNNENPPGNPPPPPGANGDNVGGWSISDYAVYGDRAVSISNSVVINGNTGTRNLSGAAFNSANSSEIYGYLAVKGSLNMSNSGAINGNSIAAACVSPSSYSTNFANSAKTNSHFWTLKNITMSNSSRINGTVSQLAGATITCYNTSGYTKRQEISAKPAFMEDPMDYTEVTTPKRSEMWGTSIFPKLPAAWDTFSGMSVVPVGGTNLNYASQTATIAGANWGNVTASNSSIITLTPGSTFKDFYISNSSFVNMSSGNYYFNKLDTANSSKIRFTFTEIGGQKQPIRLFVKTTFSLSNSSSFEYINGGTNNGADLVYVEPITGMSCANSVQWRGFIYVPNGNVSFTNSSTLTGAVYSGREVQFSNSTNVTYVPPAYDYITTDGDGKHSILLGDKFYPQIAH